MILLLKPACFVLQAVGGHGSARIVPTGLKEALKPCWAIATSGVPVREQLFNGTVCRHSPFQIFPQVTLGGFGRQQDSGDFVEVLAPIIVPHPDGKRHRKGSHGDIIFLNSRGEVDFSNTLSSVLHQSQFPFFLLSLVLEMDTLQQ